MINPQRPVRLSGYSKPALVPVTILSKNKRKRVTVAEKATGFTSSTLM